MYTCQKFVTAPWSAAASRSNGKLAGKISQTNTRPYVATAPLDHKLHIVVPQSVTVVSKKPSEVVINTQPLTM